MKLTWTEVGQQYSRVNTATGDRGTYRIALDMPADRWALALDNRRLMENIYDLREAKRFAQEYDNAGSFASALPSLLLG
jgi:hypothetical protein